MATLQGKVALITGGARGLGAATAVALAEKGAAVVIADILLGPGEAHAAALREAGHQADFLALDVRMAHDWQMAMAQVAERFGRLDCLVNNAGITLSATIEDATLEQFQHILDTNLLGAFLGIRAALPMMKAGGGSIINISSNSTQMIVPLAALYSATKSALANLTKTTAAHCARSGYAIRVNSVHPGPHATAMLLGTADSAATIDIPAVRALIDAIPMARMGRPSEIGCVVAFLASDESSYMTGAELFVDGGLTMSPHAP